MGRTSLALVIVGLLSACSTEPASAPPPSVPSGSAASTARRDSQVPAEAVAALEMIAAHARAAYQKKGTLCGTAAATVPVMAMKVNGTAYQSQADEWLQDDDETRGFRCLQFHISTPQRFMYTYVAALDGKSFEAKASGMPNGDGRLVVYKITGTVGPDGSLALGPIIEEH
jgi:hypothetical protein